MKGLLRSIVKDFPPTLKDDLARLGLTFKDVNIGVNDTNSCLLQKGKERRVTIWLDKDFNVEWLQVSAELLKARADRREKRTHLRG